MKHSVLIVLGTRPEALKLVPLYFAFKEQNIPVTLCITSQHTNLLKQVLDLFDVHPDYDFAIMQEQQDLTYVSTAVLTQCTALIKKIEPSLLVVQGDTTTAFAAGQAAFYCKVPIAHIEAGLRTYDTQAPFPEEFNRRALSIMATYHFAPTATAVAHLREEKYDKKNIILAGNTIIDTLLFIKKKLEKNMSNIAYSLKESLKQAEHSNKKIILFTIHRRESFGNTLTAIFNTIKEFAQTYTDTIIYYPVHPNPQIHEALKLAQLQEVKNIMLLNPLNYEELVFLLNKVFFVLSDSGGLQEEAVALGKRILVLRDKTERVDGIQEKIAYLVGTSPLSIKNALDHVYANSHKISEDNFLPIYGDGKASKKIVSWLQSTLFQNSTTYEEMLINK